jgi:hypothetical protein
MEKYVKYISDSNVNVVNLPQDLDKLFNFVGHKVYITTIRDSKYVGILGKINKKKMKFFLSELCILNKDFSGGICSGNADYNKRWFNISSIVKVEIKG